MSSSPKPTMAPISAPVKASAWNPPVPEAAVRTDAARTMGTAVPEAPALRKARAASGVAPGGAGTVVPAVSPTLEAVATGGVGVGEAPAVGALPDVAPTGGAGVVHGLIHTILYLSSEPRDPV